MENFEGLSLAFVAAAGSGSLPTVYNAANERAVALFLERKIGFLEIPEIIRSCMEAHHRIENPTVEEILMVTPPGKDGKVNPVTLAAAHLAGVTDAYKVGGAQAVAALAFGTESIPRVDKIAGPGNIFVALAKKAVYGHVSIDSIAGPSEILVLADESANPRYVANWPAPFW